MRNNIIITAISISVSIAFSACGGTPPANNSAPANVKTNANVAVNAANTSTPADDPTKTIVKPVAETSNNAPTVGPVAQAYFEALKKGDDAGLKNAVSTAFLRSVAAEMKKDKKTGSMAAYLAEFDGVATKPIEVRNEKMLAVDKALVQIKGANYLQWTDYILIKENGAWKWTGQSPDLDSVKQSAPPAAGK